MHVFRPKWCIWSERMKFGEDLLLQFPRVVENLGATKSFDTVVVPHGHGVSYVGVSFCGFFDRESYHWCQTQTHALGLLLNLWSSALEVVMLALTTCPDPTGKLSARIFLTGMQNVKWTRTCVDKMSSVSERCAQKMNGQGRTRTGGLLNACGKEILFKKANSLDRKTTWIVDCVQNAWFYSGDNFISWK